jgi:hypothetical protein
MIINSSYFQGNLKVPNTQDALTPLSDRRGNEVNLGEYIIRYETQIMIYALGNALYSSFIDSFETNGDVKTGAEQRWKDFINGVDYTIDGTDKVWKGLRYLEGGLNYSLIAYYVYSKFLPDISTTFGAPGIQKNNAKASRGYSSIPKTADIWNEFLYKYQGGELPTNNYPIKYESRGLSGLDWSQQQDSEYFTSMYRYLQDNADQYDGLMTRLFAVENSFGL